FGPPPVGNRGAAERRANFFRRSCLRGAVGNVAELNMGPFMDAERECNDEQHEDANREHRTIKQRTAAWLVSLEAQELRHATRSRALRLLPEVGPQGPLSCQRDGNVGQEFGRGADSLDPCLLVKDQDHLTGKPLPEVGWMQAKQPAI